MSHRALEAHGRPAATGLGQILGAVRLVLTAGFLAFGIWSALPTLAQIELPSPLALPTAAPQANASAVVTAAASVQAALTRAQQSGRSVPVSVTLTDADLTAAVQAYFPQTYAGVTVSAPSVRVSAGRIVLTATARSFLGSGPLVASAIPYASDGRLAVRVDSVTLGGLALPDGMRAQVEQQLQAAIDAAAGARLQVSSVTASQGVLTLKGAALP